MAVPATGVHRPRDPSGVVRRVRDLESKRPAGRGEPHRVARGTVPSLALRVRAMTDTVSPVTVGTVQGLEKHDATRWRWRYVASETLLERSLIGDL